VSGRAATNSTGSAMNDSAGADTWVEVPDGSPFPLHNLPFGIARRDDGTVGAFVAIGDTVRLRGWAGADPATRIGLGSVTGTIITATSTVSEGN
jgi:hypothetical protein